MVKLSRPSPSTVSTSSGVADGDRAVAVRVLSSRWIPLVGFFAIAFLAPEVLSPARTIIGGTCGIYALFAMGLCAIFSYTGYPSMAQAGLGAAAAYTMAVLTNQGVVGPEVASVIAIVGVAALALVIGVPMFLLQGFYFAMTTLLLGSIATVLIGSVLAKYTGGFVAGIPVRTPNLLGVNFADYHERYYAIWVVVAICTLMLSNLERTLVVRRARAVKGNERVGQLNGIRPLWVKLQMFVVSSVFISLASLLLIFSTQYTSVDTFDLSLTVTIFAGLVVGGRSSVWGAIAGALFIVVVNELLRDISFLHRFQTQATLIYGLVMAMVLLWTPGGLVDLPRAVRLHRRSPSTDLDIRTLPSQPRSWRHAEELGETPSVVTDAERLLAVSGLTLRFGEFVAVDDVGFEVLAGEILGIMGPNGAGKTTVLNGISGYLRPTSGSVMLRGVEIVGHSVDAIRRAGLARTLQTPHVYDDMKVWENIAIGIDFSHRSGLVSSALALPRSRRAESQIREEAVALADIVGLTKFIDRLGGELSFGQRRLVEIARAFGGRSRMLLLDEPMAGLSPAMAEVVQELVVNAAGRGYGVVLIEHNFDHVEAMADHGIFMLNGTVAKRGTIASLLNDRQVIEEYVGV
jgi:branched-chain amino acid transport system permease protein